MRTTLFLSAIALAASPAALADSLSQGQTAQFSFNVVAGQSYEIGFRTLNNTPNPSASLGDPNSNCVLLVNNSASQPSATAFQYYVSAPDDSLASLVVEGSSAGQVRATVYALNACDYEPPAILAQAAVADTLALGAGRGQLGDDYSQLATSSVDGGANFSLRDISRRAGLAGAAINPNAGQMPFDGEIAARRVFGYWGNNDLFMVENRRDTDNVWDAPADGELLDALVNSGRVYDYWLAVLGINGFDRAGAPMYAVTNAPFPPLPAPFCGQTYPANSLYNAFWDGAEIVFTPRDFTDIRGNYYRDSLAAALDVVAHEWGHAISDRAVNLVYNRESGALNEAYSDWMGAAVEFANGESNWTLGEGVLTIRDMANPKAFGQPDTYKGQNWEATDSASCPTPDICVNDYCGVHTNSGVPNKMFQLLAAGGSHNGVAVSGIGVDTALKIATDALHFHWTANEDFAGARAGMEAAAVNYGAEAVTQVGLAWDAVGVKPQSGLDRIVSSGGGGGGCSAGSGSPFDPTLWLLLLITSAGTLLRRGALLRRRFAR